MGNRKKINNCNVRTRTNRNVYTQKEICRLIRRVTEKKLFIKVFRFVGTNKSIATCIEKEVQRMN